MTTFATPKDAVPSREQFRRKDRKQESKCTVAGKLGRASSEVVRPKLSQCKSSRAGRELDTAADTRSIDACGVATYRGISHDVRRNLKAFSFTLARHAHVRGS